MRTALSELQNELKKCGADVKWVRPESIHLTLKFLGDIKEKDVDSIVKLIEGTCKKHTVFNLEIKGTGVFPNMRAPRVIWIGIDGAATIMELQRELEDGVASLGFEKENRSFSPHLTLGRFRSLWGKEALIEKIETYKDGKLVSIDVNSISLMKSELSPAGAKYTKLAEVFLKDK